MYDLLKLILLASAVPMISLTALEPAVNESDYFATRVQENLRRLGQYAGERKVDWKTKEPAATSVMSAVWAPESYQPYLRSTASGIVNDTSDVNLNTTKALLDPTAYTMAMLSEKISAEIQKRPASAELHDHAAMLMATLILRESSGRFYDTRELLSRTTAHLAFARFLKPDPTPAGIIARAILEAEQGHALRAMKLSQQLPQSLSDWKHVIAIRVTGDWRTPGASKSLLFRLLHTRAFLAASNGEVSQRIVDGIRLQDEHIRGRTDWYRLFLQDPPSRKFVLNKLNEALQLEGAEMTGVMTTFKIAPGTQEESIALLNQTPEYIINPNGVGMPTVAVLDWGTWAAHYHRHFCHNLMFVLGEQMIERKLHGLTFYPYIILQQRRQPNGLSRKVFRDAFALLYQQPHRVNAVNRMQLKSLSEQAVNTHIDPFEPLSSTPYLSPENRNMPTLGFAPAVVDLQDNLVQAKRWVEGLPTGSNYRAVERYSAISSASKRRIEKENPYSSFYAQRRVDDTDGSDLPSLDSIAGPRAHYDLHVMKLILRKLPSGSSDHLKLLGRVAEISPNAILAKANLLYKTGKTDDAASVFNKAVEVNLSTRLLSENALWMVDYLQKNGKNERALDLAKTAAAEGGHAHRQRYIRLLESLDKRAEAEKAVFSMQKHFPVSIPLISFYVQTGRLNGNTQGERNVSTALGEIKYRPRLLESERNAAFGAAEAVIFPGGRTTFRARSGAPNGGLVIKTAKEGLNVSKDDILVAFNSTALHDVYQYHFLRRETDAVEATLTLWGKGRGHYVAKVNLKEWDDSIVLAYSKHSRSRLEERLSLAAKTGKLNLSRLGLEALPPEVFELKEIRSLNLSGNPLKSLPKEIGAMQSLDSLDVSNCALRELPSEIGAMKELVDLKAAENYLKSLPDSLADLPRLEMLNLKENDFAECPRVIAKLTTLKYLVLSNNRISSIPGELGQLQKLQALSLGRNDFTTFPEQLFELKGLRRLVLLDNNISLLPDGIDRMQGLIRLDMRGNRLSSLPRTLTSITSLNQLQLGRNAFTTLPDSLWDQESLVELDLGGNGLTQVSPSIVKLKRLRLLVLSSNRLSKFPATLPEMHALRKVEYGGNYFAPEHTLVMINMTKKVTFSGDTYE